MTHIMLTARARLLNRRPNETETLNVCGQTFEACVGFDAKGAPRELFLNGAKEGSQFEALLSDAATTISIALQYGVPPAVLAKSVGRAPELSSAPGSFLQLAAGSEPASAIGAALDLLVRMAPRVACQGVGKWNHR
jgi:hypothetical protein